MTDTANRLSHDVLVSSFTVSVLSALVSGGCALKLVKSSFPSYFGVFVGHNSALRYITFRCRVLLLASTLYCIDSISQAAHFLSLELVGTTNYFATRVVFILCFPCTGALLTFATCLRCAVIVTTNPHVTRRLLILCALCCVAMASFVFVTSAMLLLELMQRDPTKQGRLWAATVYIPVLSSYFTGMNPVIATGMSVWALSANLRTPRQQGKSSTSTLSLSSLKPRIAATPRQMPTKKEDPSNAIPNPSPSPSQLSSSHPHSPPAQDSSPSSPQPGSSPIAHPKTQLSYPLSASFVLLTATIIALWTMVICFHLLLGPYVGSVRTNVMAGLLGSLCTCVETSFERLMRIVSHHRAKKNQDTGGGHHFFGMTTVGVGQVKTAAGLAPSVEMLGSAVEMCREKGEG